MAPVGQRPPEGEAEADGVDDEEHGGDALVTPVGGDDGGVDEGTHQSGEQGHLGREAEAVETPRTRRGPRHRACGQGPQGAQSDQSAGASRTRAMSPGRCSEGTDKMPLAPLICITMSRMLDLLASYRDGKGRL